MDVVKALQSSLVYERVAAASVILLAEYPVPESLLIDQFMSHPGFEDEQHELKDCLQCAVKWLESELSPIEFALINPNPFEDDNVLTDIYFDEQMSELIKGAEQVSLDLFETDGGNRTLHWLERLFKKKHHPWDTKWVRFCKIDTCAYSNYFFIKFISMCMWNTEKRVFCVFSNGSIVEMSSDIIEYSGDFIEMNEYQLQSACQHFVNAQNPYTESTPVSQTTELLTMIETLKTKASKFGLMSLEVDRPGIKYPILRIGLQMVIDGSEPDYIQRTLQSMCASLNDLDESVIDIISGWFQLNCSENQIADTVKRDTKFIKQMFDKKNYSNEFEEQTSCPFLAFRLVRLFNDVNNACNKIEDLDNPFISNTFNLFWDAFIRCEQLPAVSDMDMILVKAMVAREFDLRAREICFTYIKNIQKENNRGVSDVCEQSDE